MHIYMHKIAGVTIQTESDVAIPYLEDQRFAAFRIEKRTPDVKQRIHQFDPHFAATHPPLSPVESTFLEQCHTPQTNLTRYMVFRAPEVRARIHACLDNPQQAYVKINGRGLVFYDFRTNEFDWFYHPAVRGYFSGPLAPGGFRNLMGSFFPNFDAVMIHGAATMQDGRALVFLASDGGGKTTFVSSANGRPILSDDHVILQQQDDHITVYSTPLGRITSGQVQGQLGAFFLLEKGSDFNITPVPSTDVFQFIWNEHTHYWPILNKTLRLRTFDLLLAATGQVPTYRLRFSKDHVDWDAIDALWKSNGRMG